MIPEMLGMKNHCDWRRRRLKKASDTVAIPSGSGEELKMVKHKVAIEIAAGRGMGAGIAAELHAKG